ncbi:MAG: ABC transporter permease [Halobacteriaceae archaeon]
MTTKEQTTHQFKISTPVKWVKDWFARNRLVLLVVLGLFVLWKIYVEFIRYRGNAYFPSISYMIHQSLRFQDKLIAGVITTATEVTVGFILSVIIGVTVGIIMAESFIVRQISIPALVFTYSVPHAIMAPLFIIWFGRGLLGIGLFVAWFGFFQVMINTLTGFTQINEEFKHLGEVLNASRWQMISKIKFWAALPHIAGGIKVAVQQAIIGAVIAEFIASGGGLGFLILNSLLLLREGLTFGVLIVLMVFSVSFYKVVTFLIDYLSPGPGGV